MAATNRNRGFTQIEALMVVAVGIVAAAILVVASTDSRRRARLGSDLASLHRIAADTASYANDNSVQAPTFSWRAGTTPSKYPDLQNAATDLDAAAFQAVDILRRRTGRLEIPRITSWIPHLLYSHLVLLDYIGVSLPDLTYVSSADKNRGQWARDPYGFDANRFSPNQPPASPTQRRWPYSSSYRLPTAWFDEGASPNRIALNVSHQAYTIPPSAVLRGRALAATAFPSQKVYLHDEAGRHSGRRQAYYAVPAARVTMLFADGAADLRATRDGNRGWQPNSPTSPFPTHFQYQPSSWEVPTSNGQSSEQLFGMYSWTRGGRDGRDFGGPEVGP